MGESDDRHRESERLRRTVQLMQAAGLNASCAYDLQRDVFVKLLRNAAFNSICALTGLPMEWLPLTPSVRELTLTVMDEVVEIACTRLRRARGSEGLPRA